MPRTAQTTRIAPRSFANSVVFNGTSTKIVSASNTGISGNTAVSMEAWIKPTNAVGWQAIGSIGAAASKTAAVLGINGTLNGSLDFDFGAFEAYSGAFATNVNSWFHVVVVKDAGAAESNTTVYVNGVLQALTFTTTGSITITNSTLLIGSYLNATAWFSGEVALFRLYNTILTKAQVAALYQNNLKPSSGVVVEYLFSEGSGSTVADTSGNGNTGTITSGTWSTDVPIANRLFQWNIPGSLVLNGSTGYATIGTSTATYSFIQNSLKFSTWGWVKISSASKGVEIAFSGNIATTTAKGFLFVKLSTDFINLSVVYGSAGNRSVNTTTTTTGCKISIDDFDKWIFIGVSSNGTTSTFYVGRQNGVLSTETTTGGTGTLSSGDSDNNLLLGILPGSIDTLNGNLTDMAVHSAALTATQMTSIFNLGTSVAGISPVSYWKFGNGSGSTLTDSGTAAKNGTITTAVWSTDSPMKSPSASSGRVTPS